MPKKIHNIEGVQFGSASSKTRYGDKEDSLVVSLPSSSKLSGKFTSNKLRAAPVELAINNLSVPLKGEKVLLINAGNANAATGPKGLRNVKKYCLERNNNIDAETFFDFYESKDWLVGKNKMKNWKACIRTWEKRKSKTNNTTSHRHQKGGDYGDGKF